ncbi:MAG: ABC transporter permease [Cypionkella sp.]
MSLAEDSSARIVPNPSGQTAAGPTQAGQSQADPDQTIIDGSQFDAEEERHARAQRLEAVGKWALPTLVVVLTLYGWDRVVAINHIPHYILPSPGLVAETLVKDWSTLFPSMLVTLKITLMALTVAVIGGVALAILFTQSKFAEMAFFPYAVILQVTPIVSVAPLIFIYVDNRIVALLICAWVVAFFPILANTTLGLKSADHNLRDLMTIYRASRWQRLRYLQLPSALPYFLGGLRIAGGLSLIGAVVAEYVAGTGGIGSGLAFRILEAGYRLNIPRMFAALFLIAFLGVVIFMATTILNWFLLRKWHESAIKRDT